MYINPFAAGVLTTLVVEMAIVLLWAIDGAIKNVKKWEEK